MPGLCIGTKPDGQASDDAEARTLQASPAYGPVHQQSPAAAPAKGWD